jgi:hypothetical protein
LDLGNVTLATGSGQLNIAPAEHSVADEYYGGFVQHYPRSIPARYF